MLIEFDCFCFLIVFSFMFFYVLVWFFMTLFDPLVLLSLISKRFFRVAKRMNLAASAAVCLVANGCKK